MPDNEVKWLHRMLDLEEERGEFPPNGATGGAVGLARKALFEELRTEPAQISEAARDLLDELCAELLAHGKKSIENLPPGDVRDRLDAAAILRYKGWNATEALRFCEAANSGRYLDLIPVGQSVIDILTRCK